MATFKTELRGAFVLALLLFGTALYGQSSSVNLFIDPSPNPVGPNADITYSIVVSSEGPDDAQNMSMTFTAPPTTSFQSLSAPAGWSCNPPAVGTTNTVITCTLATFPPGSSTFTVVMRVPANAANGSVLDATATVTSTTSDPDSEDNTDTKSVTVQSVSDLGVDKSGPATVIAGDTFDYTLTVTNNGPNSADATLTDTLDSNLTFVSISPNAGWTCNESLGVVTCTNPSFAPGTVNFTLTVQVAQISGGTVTNDVSISSTSLDNVLPNNQDSVTSTVITRADLTVTKTGPASIAPGNDIAYSIGLTNNGPSDAQNVTLTDNVTRPFVSLTSPGGWSCTTPTIGATGLITCTVGTLPSGANAAFTLTVHSNDPLGTVITNTAQASSSTTDPVASNNSATATTRVASPATLSATKTITAGQPTAGTNVTYDVVITNNGPGTQFDNPGNEMLDQLPAGLTLISATATSGTAVADLPNNRVTWNGSLPNGGSVTITIVAQINDITTRNQATLNYDADGNGTNESTTTSNSAGFALSPATLSVTKTIASGAAVAGSNVTYSVVITNNGPATQLDNPGNEMDDQLPPGLTLISATATSGTAVADLPNNRVTWNGSIPNGGTVTVTIVARINDIRATNEATVHYDADGNGTNESSATSAPATFGVAIPSLTPMMLAALAALLAALAMRRV